MANDHKVQIVNLSLIIKLLGCILLASTLTFAAENENVALSAGLINPGFHEKPNWFRHSFLDLREDVEEAADSGKRILLFFHQDGCPYCAKLLNENWSLRPLVEKTQENFEVIAINIWGDQEVTDLRGRETTEKRFSESLKVMYTPTLIFLDEAGRQALRINGYYPPHKFEAALDYVAGHLERKQPYRDYLASVQPQAVSGKLHQEVGFLPLPLDLRAKARESNKPLLVLMEQKACSACDELHGKIMRIPAVRKTLEAFDIALVDVWSGETLTTPGGVQRTVNEWTKELGIQYVPSMLFFDPTGKEVFRAEAFLKTFHTHAAMDYVSTGAYLSQPNFQRYVQSRAAEMEAQGITVDLME